MKLVTFQERESRHKGFVVFAMLVSFLGCDRDFKVGQFFSERWWGEVWDLFWEWPWLVVI